MKELILNTSEKAIKSITKEITINRGMLDTYIDAYISDADGSNKKLVVSKKGDSLVANFLKILFYQMGADYYNDVSFWYLRKGSTITNVTNNGSGKVRLSFPSYPVDLASGSLSVGGIIGVPANGLFNYTRINSYTLDLNDVAYSGSWLSGTGYANFFQEAFNILSPSYTSFRYVGIYVGAGTGSVTINDYALQEIIPNASSSGSITYNSSVVSQDTNDSTSAQVTMTRTFTNNSPGTLNVNEVGLFLKVSTSSLVLMVARDLTGGIEVQAGKTLTINYRIKTILDSGTDPGGFVASFMRLLYRMISNASRAVFDVNNVSRSYESTPSTFMALSCGGYNRIGALTGSPLGYQQGIMVGTGSTSVSMGDYYLDSPIIHGNNSNQLLYSGGFLQNFSIVGSTAQFDIIKYMENGSGASITVREIGLDVGGEGESSGNISGYEIPKYLYLISRNVLTTPITILNGQILKVTYSLKVIV